MTTPLARQFYFELLKLFARQRTHLGFVAFLVVELIILSMMQTQGARRLYTRTLSMGGISFDHYNSGLTLAQVMITYTVFLLGSLYLALVSGDMIAKETEDGTLRMVLSRPVSRDRVLLLKYAACAFYTLTLTLFIVASSLLLGIAVKGLGGLLVVNPFEHLFGMFELGVGLERFALGTVLLFIAMLTISTIGFCFSCFNLKPATATILTLSVYLIDNVIRTIPFFESYSDNTLTYNMGIWSQAFQQDIPWKRILDSLLYLLTLDALFLFVGAFHFSRRDFKS